MNIFMRIMKVTGNLSALFFCATLLATGSTYSSSSIERDQLPAELYGKWEVREVHRNTQSSRSFQYGWNSPMLMWRIFDINSSRIANNTPERAIACANPVAISKIAEMGDTLNRILAHEASETGSVAKDYGLSIPEKESVKFVHINCTSGAWNGSIYSSLEDSEVFSDGSWLFFISKDEIALRWYDETILILKLIPPSAKPSPSFSCNNARLDSERAICKSYELSGLDKGVASAYRTLLEFSKSESPGDVVRARTRQKEWLAIRNSCEYDGSCLANSMENRISEINMQID